eukprot:1252865-Rhodomonas_salina.1
MPTFCFFTPRSPRSPTGTRTWYSLAGSSRLEYTHGFRGRGGVGPVGCEPNNLFCLATQVALHRVHKECIRLVSQERRTRAPSYSGVHTALGSRVQPEVENLPRVPGYPPGHTRGPGYPGYPRVPGVWYPGTPNSYAHNCIVWGRRGARGQLRCAS